MPQRPLFKFNKRLKKILLIGLSIILALPVACVVLFRLSFGPLHNSVTIDFGSEGKLLCEETYNADLAAEFYDVVMTLQTSGGKEYPIGTALFHSQNWHEAIKPLRIDDWLLIPIEASNFSQIKMINTTTGALQDTTLRPVDLRQDVLYKKRYKNPPSRLYDGSSKLESISKLAIEVIYEYDEKAEYPPLLRVNQKVIYTFNTSLGKLETKELFDTELQ